MVRLHGLRAKIFSELIQVSRKAMASRKDGLSIEGRTNLIRQAHGGKEKPYSYEGQGEGNEG